jgi:hypothetical protein
MLRRVLLAALVMGLVGVVGVVGVVGAEASRRPTRQEANEIRTDAKLYLHGRNWRVSGIRVSTVNGLYAKAAVQQGRNGPGGEMLLRLRHGIWHEVFLGTDGFCSAKVPKRVLNDLGFRC